MVGTDEKDETAEKEETVEKEEADVVAEGAPDLVASTTPAKSEMAMAETPEVAAGEKRSLSEEDGNKMDESPPKKEKAAETEEKAAGAKEKAAGAEVESVEKA